MLKKLDENNPVIKILKFFFGDIVQIYTALIMMSIMYHYRSSLTAVYGCVAIILTALLFRLFDYIAKHKLIGTAAYLAVFISFIFSTRLCVEKGAQEYPLSFGVWFLTPQDALDYSKWYTLAMFLLFMIFMASVIYYFTKVRYRIFMNFLIFIIPFALYGKEYEKMPTAFIMLLAIGYIAIMINCRQIASSEKVEIVNKGTLWISSAVFIVIFASLAAIVPKPYIEADREILETLISADQFTDRLINMLNVFQDTSTGEQFRSAADETPIYFVKAEEPMRLKTLTFSTYDYDTDSWEVTENDTRFMYTTEDREIEIIQTGSLLNAILSTAENNEEFAAKYGLENLAADKLTFPKISSVEIITVNSNAQFAPVPPNMTKLTYTTSDKPIALIRSGLVYCTDGRFSFNESFTYEYCTDTFFSNENNKSLAELMSRDDYDELIFDAYIAAYGNNIDAENILQDEWRSLDNHSAYLEYGDNQEILNLAQQITAGLSSDYDKAKAIERYFTDAGFLYDLNYRKEKGENTVDFLYETKRGVCYEFATAMVLLSRAAGIPARYCEGYNMNEQYSNQRLGTNYVVKSRDAHGFPELYIRGVGWVSFEPTVSSMALNETGQNATEKLSSAGIFLLIIALLFLLCVKLYPIASHKILLIRLKKADSESAVVLMMRRISRLYKTDSSLTSQETADYVYRISGCDISKIAHHFDEAVYGNVQFTDDNVKDALIAEYIMAYEALRETKRHKNKETQTV